MGTHPIFENDFDCLTEWPKPKSPRRKFTITQKRVKKPAALDSVTDHVVEKEISGANVDSILKRSQKTEVQEQIKIKSKDIELIMKEMECSRSLAQKALFEGKGDLYTALRSFIN